jgi:hypothetical protein
VGHFLSEGATTAGGSVMVVNGQKPHCHATSSDLSIAAVMLAMEVGEVGLVVVVDTSPGIVANGSPPQFARCSDKS